MSVFLKAYSAKEMVNPFSNNDSYSIPIDFGSLADPLDGLNGDLTTAIPIWLKNTGDETISNIFIIASDGSVDIGGGAQSTTADAFIELALDTNINLPDSQPIKPTSFIKATSAINSAQILCSNVIDTSGNPKSTTSEFADDDARTMLPGEYAIIWLRCGIDDARSVGGALPTISGIHNIKLSARGLSVDVSPSKGSLGVAGRIFIETTIALWHFDDGSGSIATDSFGNNDGDITGAMWWSIGIGDKSLQFDGSDNVNCGNANSLNPGIYNMTIDTWIKSPEDNVSSGTILKKRIGNIGYELSMDSSGYVSFFLGDVDGNFMTASDGVYLNDTGWHHLLVTIDRTNDVLKFYINKVQESVDYDISYITGNITNNEDFLIGGSFTGRIDEASVYNRILSSSEVDVKFTSLWDAYLAVYGITDDGEWVTDNNGRIVVDEIL